MKKILFVFLFIFVCLSVFSADQANKSEKYQEDNIEDIAEENTVLINAGIGGYYNRLNSFQKTPPDN